MAIRITAIRLAGGTSHEHITRLWWTNPATGTSGDNSRAEIVQWIEAGNEAYVQDSYGSRAEVRVVKPAYGEKYLRTMANGKWTDNLLSLPKR